MITLGRSQEFEGVVLHSWSLTVSAAFHSRHSETPDLQVVLARRDRIPRAMGK
jgi:hypothetical protein